MDPVFPPKHATGVVEVESEIAAAGCVMVADVVAVHKFASLTVTVYVPAINPVGSSPVNPLLQLYV